MIVNDTIYKFDEDGKALPYYGNTIVSYLNDDRWPIFNEAIKAQEILKKASFAECLAFLPPSSFHMTVLTLCREIDRGTKYWPANVPVDAKFMEVDRYLMGKVKEIEPPKDVMVEVEECEVTKIILKPYRKEDGEKLADYRDKVANLVGIKHYWHDYFRYHLTLDYQVKELNDMQKSQRDEICRDITKYLKSCVEPFAISEPKFVIFNDMLSYETELSKRGNDC